MLITVVSAIVDVIGRVKGSTCGAKVISRLHFDQLID